MFFKKDICAEFIKATITMIYSSLHLKRIGYGLYETYLITVRLFDLFLVFLSENASESFDSHFWKLSFQNDQTRFEVPRITLNDGNDFVVGATFHDENLKSFLFWCFYVRLCNTMILIFHFLAQSRVSSLDYFSISFRSLIFSQVFSDV
jgi:hypothetical protein